MAVWWLRFDVYSELSCKSKLWVVMLVMLLSTRGSSSSCHSCGNLNIPFPFGTTSDCSLDDSFLIFCNESYNPPKPFLTSDAVEVLHISLDDGIMKVSSPVAADCYDKLGARLMNNVPHLPSYKFPISITRNKFVANGCDTYALIEWSVGNRSCEEAERNLSSFACRGNNTECRDSSTGIGYLCRCLPGFQGDPYQYDGCYDINECESSNPCEGSCSNLEGSYSCSCPNGYEGDGKKDGSRCHPKSRISGATLFYAASGVMVAAIIGSWIFWRRKQKKLIIIKQRQTNYYKNGGLILDSMQSITLQNFSSEAIERATDNYSKHNILWNNHHYHKGILSDNDNANLKVIIQNCVEFSYERAAEDFIHKSIILSQIRHKNVVKLVGCCLETSGPLSIYEFVNMTPLYDHIHDPRLARALSWDIRLDIAVQTAGALVYMHHDTEFGPIIHGDIKTPNIFLQSGYNVKLLYSPSTTRDFYTRILGYLDPEFFMSGQETTKGDVYSFGVVLAELLRGENALYSVETGERIRLSTYFVNFNVDEDLIRFLDPYPETEGKVEQLTEVAKLAQACLSERGVDRPTMKEVVMTLESIRSRNSGAFAISPNHSQETTARRVGRRNWGF